MKITEFTINGFFGGNNITIPIKNNKVILVGVNGIGKSTILNMFYYTLSRRWNKLLENNFSSISIKINGITHTFTREEVQEYTSGPARRDIERYIRNKIAHGASSIRPSEAYELLISSNFHEKGLFELSSKLNIPPATLRRLRADMIGSGRADLFAGNQESFVKINKILEDTVKSTILYLPTYRRIEKELKAIVPEIETRIRSFEDKFIRTVSPNSDTNPPEYIDLVEFGMEDVKIIVDRKLFQLSVMSRQRFNALAGSYLGEVIRGVADEFDPSVVANYDADDVRYILDRAGEGQLSASEKQILLETLSRVHADPDNISARDRYSAHFFAKLADLSKNIEELEDPLERLIKVCNKNYLFHKKIVYDRANYKISVILDDGQAVDIRQLSSGEKQIVSIFCHLYLGISSNYIVIIDEPELSLSVDWQINFLPDIMDSGRCCFVAAVTHSPFIYDNSFDDNAVDVLDCISGKEGMLFNE